MNADRIHYRDLLCPFMNGVRILRALCVISLTAMLAACATVPSRGPVRSFSDRKSQWLQTELHFPMGSSGARVMESEWRAFVEDYILPRFEESVMEMDASEEKMTETGRRVQDFKIIILRHHDTEIAQASIEYIRAAFSRKHEQKAVLRVSFPVRLSQKPSIEVPVPRKAGELSDPAINESSGLASARCQKDTLFTHNDSGDAPRFFAMDLTGRILGVYELPDAGARDWEDMASVQWSNQCCLLLADVGDNPEERDLYSLYVVKEPMVLPDQPVVTQRLELVRTVPFVYEDGPHNCEAVAMDPNDGVIYLVSKNWGWSCKVYALDPNSGDPAVARKIAGLGLPRVTAMDFSPDGLKAIVLTYGDAYEFTKAPGKTWAEAFLRIPTVYPMPKRRQGESICYGADRATVYLTSEQLPAPLWEVFLPVNQD